LGNAVPVKLYEAPGGEAGQGDNAVCLCRFGLERARRDYSALRASPFGSP
jgi:hypothetical protein